ncbi:MAG: hypothetical protein R3C03_18655 [Pirellulaceae bacterium]
MSQFSIVVPFLVRSDQFDETLASVLRHRPERSQIIVPHDGSYTDPYGLKSEVDFVVCRNQVRLVNLWNESLANAMGEFVCLFQAGVELSEGWEFSALDLFVDSTVAAVAPVVTSTGSSKLRRAYGVSVDGTGTRRLVERERQAKNVVGPTSIAAIYRNDALGWVPQLDEGVEDLYLDAELGLALQSLGYRSETAKDWVVSTGDDQWFVHQQAPHGCSAARALVRYSQKLKAGGTPIVGDLLAACTGRTWRFRHAMGRLSASRFAAADKSANEQLMRNKKLLVELRAEHSSRASSNLARRAA